MVYRSEVGLVVSEKIDILLRQDAEVARLLGYADQREESKQDKAILYYWQSIKWYSDNSEIRSLHRDLNDQEDDYEDWYFLRLGEDCKDVEESGGWYDNPFGLCIRRELEFCGRDRTAKPAPGIDLKSENTKPGATHCAACGGALNDLGMGPAYKHCPVCEP